MSDIDKHDPIQGKIVHEYDGILEADNGLPWWLTALFLGTTAFAVLYWFYYQEFEIGQTPLQTYAVEVERKAAKGGVVSEELLLAMKERPDVLATGKQLYGTNCAQCHGDRGQGQIGPNLTDGNWLHGGGELEIHAVIHDGVAAKGMPAWGPILGPQGVQQVTAFILSLRNTNVPGKAPEGTLWAPGQKTESAAASDPARGSTDALAAVADETR